MFGRIALTVVAVVIVAEPVQAGDLTPAKKAALEAARDLEGLTGEIARGKTFDTSKRCIKKGAGDRCIRSRQYRVRFNRIGIRRRCGYDIIIF